MSAQCQGHWLGLDAGSLTVPRTPLNNWAGIGLCKASGSCSGGWENAHSVVLTELQVSGLNSQAPQTTGQHRRASSGVPGLHRAQGHQDLSLRYCRYHWMLLKSWEWSRDPRAESSPGQEERLLQGGESLTCSVGGLVWQKSCMGTQSGLPLKIRCEAL